MSDYQYSITDVYNDTDRPWILLLEPQGERRTIDPETGISIVMSFEAVPRASVEMTGSGDKTYLYVDAALAEEVWAFDRDKKAIIFIAQELPPKHVMKQIRGE